MKGQLDSLFIYTSPAIHPLWFLTYCFVYSKCYCTQGITKTSVKVDNSRCDTACDGDGNISCGGHGFVVVYSTNPGDDDDDDATLDAKNTRFPDEDDAAAGIEAPAAEVPNVGQETTSSATAAVIAGSVIGCVFFAVLLFMAFALCKRRASKEANRSHRRTESAGVENRPSGPPKELPTREPVQAAGPYVSVTSIRLPRIPSLDRLSISTVGTSILCPGGDPSVSSVSLPVSEQASATGRVATPDKAASTHGLGDRAWHRRRLSMPFPPSPPIGFSYRLETNASFHEYTDEDMVGLREALNLAPEGVSSGGYPGGVGSDADGLFARPLPTGEPSVSSLDVQASDDEHAPPSTPRWSIWTAAVGTKELGCSRELGSRDKPHVE
jgi:hypothetical protein